MKNLGKIVASILFLSISLYARVSASLDSDSVYSGEMVTYRLSISGDEVQKPSLTDICGNEIVATGSQTSIENINGNYSKTYTLSYQFMPQDSCTIESVSVIIDGELEHSNSVELHIKEPAQDKTAPFVLTLEPSKSSLYVGEPFEVMFTLTQQADAQLLDYNFVAPDFKGFWLKSESEPKREQDAERIITKVLYTLAPQREGNLSIAPAQLRVASRVRSANSWGAFAPQVKWRSFYSNRPTFQVKALPNGAKLIGDFTIEARVSKREVEKNEALNLTLVVEGIGNLEDIKSFKPSIEGVSVFDEKINIEGNRLTQKFAFVGSRDFTIAPFELVYFSTKTQKVHKIQTEPIEIKVKGQSAQEPLNIERGQSEDELLKESPQGDKYGLLPLVLVFVFGVIVGASLMRLRSFMPRKHEKQLDLSDEKLLMVKLLPFKEESGVAEIMDILEKNIYSDEKSKIDKKRLKEILKRHNIS